jgi:hypothetical protein
MEDRPRNPTFDVANARWYLPAGTPSTSTCVSPWISRKAVIAIETAAVCFSLGAFNPIIEGAQAAIEEPPARGFVIEQQSAPSRQPDDHKDQHDKAPPLMRRDVVPSTSSTTSSFATSTGSPPRRFRF